MNDTKGYCMILTSCPNNQEAEELATKMIKLKLAACIQVTTITSYYEWQGSSNKDIEYLMLIKTRSELYPGIEKFIKEHHSYEVPEIIMIPVQNGLPAYLNWIDEVTG